MWLVTRFGIVQFKKREKHPGGGGGVSFSVKLKAKACNFTKINTPPWVFFMFLKLYKWYQITQSITNVFTVLLRYSQPYERNIRRYDRLKALMSNTKTSYLLWHFVVPDFLSHGSSPSTDDESVNKKIRTRFGTASSRAMKVNLNPVTFFGKISPTSFKGLSKTIDRSRNFPGTFNFYYLLTFVQH